MHWRHKTCSVLLLLLATVLWFWINMLCHHELANNLFRTEWRRKEIAAPFKFLFCLRSTVLNGKTKHKRKRANSNKNIDRKREWERVKEKETAIYLSCVHFILALNALIYIVMKFMWNSALRSSKIATCSILPSFIHA